MAAGVNRQTDQHRQAYGFDLGSYRRTVSTTSPAAQRWFDRGLIWSYAFNHEEAIACFERAVTADPRFAMAYWGLAYAVGPNYNKQWDAFDEDDLRASLHRSREATVRAAGLAVTGSHLERDLIGTLESRYPSDQPDGDLAARNVAYADAMGEVYRAHRHDLDVAALYADALLNLTAWSPSGR
jgi:tetratricopeptide (TPR) repeat protein